MDTVHPAPRFIDSRLLRLGITTSDGFLVFRERKVLKTFGLGDGSSAVGGGTDSFSFRDGGDLMDEMSSSMSGKMSTSCSLLGCFRGCSS